MKFIIVRLDDSTFYLGVGRKNAVEMSMLEDYDVRHAIYKHCPGITYGSADEERKKYHEQGKRFFISVTGFAMRYRQYQFWDVFEFYGGEFSHPAKSDYFFEHRKCGPTLQYAMGAMKATHLL